MTVVEDPPLIEDDPTEVRLGEAGGVAKGIRAPDPRADDGAHDADGPAAGGSPPVTPLVASGAAFLATAAAGWMLGGIFVGSFARVVGVAAALLGAGMVWVSHRTRTPVVIQFLVLPIAVILGGVLVAPDATGGTANLPSLVVEALRSGGLSSPPVPFDPGWRFLMVLLITCIGVTGASAALATDRPRLAVFLPAPVAVAGILVQPPGSELVSVGPALALVIASLAVAFSTDLATQGTSASAFEVRRFGRAAAMIAGLVALLVVASQLGFLFPEEAQSKVIPPKRPGTPPPARDRVVFTVQSPLSVPWRMGVLDVYDGTAWLTPPFDPNRFEGVPGGGEVPGSRKGVAAEAQFDATFEITDVEGRIVPDVAEPLEITGLPEGAQIDPRTDQLRLAGRARSGTRYTVTAPVPPDAAALSAAGDPGPALQPYLEAPQPPAEVQALLAEIPPDLPLYERLQFVRTRFFEAVVAAGAGNPVDVPPSRVADMLAGDEASPYEITAGEVLLARWAGIPARVGYGYYGGEQADDGRLEIRPKHGALWLEAWFEGSGWVSIVGRPPKAKSSLSRNDKNDEPNIRPTDELGALVYVPIRLERITLLYQLVSYWLARIVPIVLALAALATFYVGFLKIGRRVRRRMWAGRIGPRERIGVAYAELRDAAIDFNIGHPTQTPIEFLDVLVEDVDHSQLAWLVTRVLWGDLRRDVRSEDAEQAELYARQLRRRLAGGQSSLMRVIAFASRASLKAPYDDTAPNLWWPWSVRAKVFAALRKLARLVGAPLRAARRAARSGRLPKPAATALLALVVVVLLGGCVQDVDLTEKYAGDPPLPAVPTTVGVFTFERNQDGAAAFKFYEDVSLAAAGELYGIRDAEGTVQGTLQTTVLKPGLSDRDDEVRRGVLQSLGGGRFKLQRLAGHRVYSLRLPEQRILLTFSPDGTQYQLLVATQGFDAAEQLLVDLLSAQRGVESASLTEGGGSPPIDPRRGP